MPCYDRDIKISPYFLYVKSNNINVFSEQRALTRNSNNSHIISTKQIFIIYLIVLNDFKVYFPSDK